MRARTFGLSVLALGILIGAGGCSSESPTSPLAPTSAAANKGGSPNAGQDTVATTTSGGYITTGNRREQPGTVTISGGYITTGN
jgi:hypothetical protein